MCRPRLVYFVQFWQNHEFGRDQGDKILMRNVLLILLILLFACTSNEGGEQPTETASPMPSVVPPTPSAEIPNKQQIATDAPLAAGEKVYHKIPAPAGAMVAALLTSDQTLTMSLIDPSGQQMGSTSLPTTAWSALPDSAEPYTIELWNTGETDAIYSLLAVQDVPQPAPDSGAAGVYVTVFNASGVDLGMNIGFGDHPLQIGEVAFGKASEPKLYSSILQSPRMIEAGTADGQTFETVFNPDWGEEPPIPSGNYRLFILMRDGELYGEVTRDMVSLTETLAALLAQFEGADLSIEVSPSAQRGSEFDQLFGEVVATKEYLTAGNQQFFVYVFDDAETAQLAATAISPGSNTLTLARESGTTQVQVGNENMVGHWWLQDRFLVLGDSALEPKLTTALGESLNTQRVGQGEINIRVDNRSDGVLEDLTLTFGDEMVEFGNVAQGVTGYQGVESADSPTLTTTLNGQSYSESADMPTVTAGDYIWIINVTDGQLRQRVFSDNEPHFPVEIMDTVWNWQRAELADGSIFEPMVDGIEKPYLRFTAITHPESGETFLNYGANAGCNGFGGEVRANANRQLDIIGGASTLMLCDEAIMEGESLLQGKMAEVIRYELDGDGLRLFTLSGDVLQFVRAEVISEQAAIYQRALRGWNSREPLVVVSEALIYDAETMPLPEMFVREESGISADLLENFERQNMVSADLTPYIDELDIDIILISAAERDAFIADWSTFEAVYPGAHHILSFSHVGFGDAADQALLLMRQDRVDASNNYLSQFVGGDGFWHNTMSSIIE